MLQQMLQMSKGAGGQDGEPDLEQLLRMAKLAQGMGGGAGGDNSMAELESLLKDVQRGQGKRAAGPAGPAGARSAREREAAGERQPPGFNWQVAIVVFILLLLGPFRFALYLCPSTCALPLLRGECTRAPDHSFLSPQRPREDASAGLQAHPWAASVAAASNARCAEKMKFCLWASRLAGLFVPWRGNPAWVG